MPDLLQSLDNALFRFLNQSLANPVFDWLMPWFSGNALFIPALIAVGIWLLWKGGPRGRLCFCFLLLLVLAANNAAVDFLKDWFARPRPFVDLPDTRLVVGRGGSYGLPSGHAANWFGAAAVVAWFYGRVAWGVIAVGAIVGFSRIYNGVHYPSDVLAGAFVGASIGAVGVVLADVVWQRFGRRWFPLWWRQLPSLRRAEFHRDPLAYRPGEPPIRDPRVAAAKQWLHLGYFVIALLLVARLGYLAAGVIQLSEDEAYQWLWSKRLALSYFSKPPLIAYLQFIGTSLWGDTEFGVRFLSPIITALVSWMVLRFMAREVNARAAFWLLMMLTSCIMVSAGSLLMTIDPPSVLGWAGAMVAGWKAVQPNSRTRDWAWVGAWIAFGFLAKFVNALQWVSFVLVLVAIPSARRQWKRPGPYVALFISALALLPVIIWNAQHDWVTAEHLRDRAGMNEVWRPTFRFFLDHTGALFGLLNPVFFCGLLWAIWQVARRRRQDAFLMYLLCMGAPLFFGYWLYTARARVLPNWIAPTVVPLFCLLVAYADTRYRAGLIAVRHWLFIGLWSGLPLILLCHESNFVNKIAGHPLPPKLDPLRRIRAWDEVGRVTGEMWRQLQAEGKPVFIIGADYGITAQVTFYLPEAKAGVPDQPLAFCDAKSINQFSFWPGYSGRKGETALYVAQVREPRDIPPHLLPQFESVENLGVREIKYRGRTFRYLQFYACRGYR